MSQEMFNLMMYAIIIVVVLVVDLIILGTLYFIGKLLFGVYLKHERAEEGKVRLLEGVMEKANSLGLDESIALLKDAGVYYDFSNRLERGHRFIFPKYFWMGSIYSEAVLIRAKTLITLATHAFSHGNNFGINTSQEVGAELLLTLFGQIKKNPNLIMAIESQLVQQIAGNARFTIVLKQLDQHQCTWC